MRTRNRLFSKKKGIGLRGLVYVTALLGLLTISNPTFASTARVEKVGVVYAADPGEVNDVTITASRHLFGGGAVAIDIEDAGPGVMIRPEWDFPWWWTLGCEENTLRPGVAVCALEQPGSSVIFVDLQDQNDRFSMMFNHGVAVQGGAGDDTLVGGAAADDLRGEGDSDTLFGGGGNDFLAGMAGNDKLFGGTGGDVFVGGTHFDTVDYSARTAPLIVTSGDAVPDGESGEGDDVAVDVESIIGGSGDDRLTISAAGSLKGGPGFDHLFGSNGQDGIDAQDGGPDVIDCGGGQDVVYADYPTEAWAGPGPPPATGIAMLIPDITMNCETIVYGH